MKHMIYAFVLALVGYVFFYQVIEHRRARNGPWHVTFTRSAAGEPALVIDQPKLSITNAQIRFVGRSSPSPVSTVQLVFGQPRPVPFDVPFGQCAFMDTTFLPGTVTFELFGHEIELLPRVLVVDHQEHAWQPTPAIALVPAETAPEGGIAVRSSSAQTGAPPPAPLGR
jgi:hypothetical protein